MKIYVAYRYSADNVHEVLANIGKAIKIGKDIALLGHYPYVPHWDYLMAIQDFERELTLQYFYDCSFAFLKVCDAMFLVDPLDLGKSKGVSLEYVYCKEHNIPVYHKLGDIPHV